MTLDAACVHTTVLRDEAVDALLHLTPPPADDQAVARAAGGLYVDGTFGRGGHSRLLLQRLAPNEIDAVLAHELGHFSRRHLPKRLFLMGSISLLGFGLLGLLSDQLWFYSGLGVRPNLVAPSSALALLLFINVAPLASFFLTPLLSQLSRRQEFEADAYACAHADGQDLASALVKLYQDNASTLTPDPLYARFYYSHPPAAERLERLPA